MSRPVAFSAAALLLAGGVLAVSRAVEATTPPTEAPAEVHSVVGAWILTVDGFPEQFTELATFQADGTMQETSTDGTTGLGSWEATGPNSFNLTFSSLSLTEQGSLAMTTIRAGGEVSEDGQSFTAIFTIERTGDGAPAGEYGPGSVTGTRLNVEPMGTPVGPLEALFPDLFPPEDGTAPLEITPASTAPPATPPAVGPTASTTTTTQLIAPVAVVDAFRGEDLRFHRRTHEYTVNLLANDSLGQPPATLELFATDNVGCFSGGFNAITGNAFFVRTSTGGPCTGSYRITNAAGSSEASFRVDFQDSPPDTTAVPSTLSSTTSTSATSTSTATTSATSTATTTTSAATTSETTATLP
jgi:hypothetical protein